MKTIRILLIACQSLALTFAAVWMYAGYRYDALNIGGAKGNVDSWDSLLTIGCVGTLVAWTFSVLVAFCGGYFEWIESKRERNWWVVASLLGTPTAIIIFYTILNSNVHAIT
ncbi:MAG: hypothetical protein V4508_27195 [Pseudomonadota bacterium]